jgi:protein-S-isoprenylcysteine O-methyltransferase Ste14
MDSDAAHTSQWAIGETIFGIPLFVGIALQIIYPIVLSKEFLRTVLLILGIILILVGWLFISLARKEFAGRGQPTDPGKPTGKIVSTGVYSISRNPMYLGCVLLFLGLSFLANSLYILGMLLISIIFCEKVLILPEENYLKNKFGTEYVDYCQYVSRWFGRK